MSFVDFFVMVCFLVATVSAACVAFHPNILYSAVSLIFSLLAVAGLYAALGADFLAAVQLIIYVGGIIVVILFAVMMSQDIYRARFLEGLKRLIAPVCVSAICLFGLLKLIRTVAWPKAVAINHAPTTDAMGLALVGPYALVFQYVAVVLLAGLIGAVIIARPQYDENGENR